MGSDDDGCIWEPFLKLKIAGAVYEFWPQIGLIFSHVEEINGIVNSGVVKRFCDGTEGETGDEVSFGEVAMEKQSFWSGFVNI